MKNRQLIFGPIIVLAFLALAAFMVTSTWADEPKAPVKTPAVLELEKEMARDVPIYNDVAPRLARNRPALETLGWRFDDTSLTAVPLE